MYNQYLSVTKSVQNVYLLMYYDLNDGFSYKRNLDVYI